MLQQQHHHQPGADMFLLFYIKRRIEKDSSLEWFEAPYCAEDEPPQEWLLLEKAALIFEHDNRKEIEETMIDRLVPMGKLNFRSFRMIVRHYLDLLSQRMEKSIALLALIAFTGLYARRLAELDAAQCEVTEEDEENSNRDYRREIYQVSIYGSGILLSTIEGSWESFCSDISKVVNQIILQKQQSLALTNNRIYGLAAVCGVGAIVASCLLIRRLNF
ncbi:hypothetical protein ACQ4LE_004262 [Meloidogyne hapla]|uniref:Uncharacterized protein n=1 Tax=Meloidogyne hapla TaxID=6305 RepID=A0A1I8BIT2_MELHA